MTDKELTQTLRTAAQTQDNIALRMLLIMAAERIETCEALARTVMLDQTAHDNYKQGEK